MKKNKYKTKNTLIFIILFVSISIIGIYIMNAYVDNLNQEYSIDIRDESSIKVRVIGIILWHGVTFIHLSNDKKYWIDNSRNYNYDNIFIDDNINVGDSIIKNNKSDSLWIKSPEGTFVFVVGESINKDKR